MVPRADVSKLLTFPASTWFQAPPGKYKAWVEGNWTISPFPVVLGFSDTPFRKRGRSLGIIVVPAGKVALDPEAQAPEKGYLSLLHTESHNRGTAPKFELSRRVTGQDLHEGTLMPAGAVLAGLYDEDRREYRTLQEVLIESGKLSRITPEPPAPGTSTLIAVLERPNFILSHEDHDLVITATLPGEEPTTPDLVVPASRRVYAVWYELEALQARVDVHSPSVFLEPQDVQLRPGHVEDIRATLQPLPSLDLSLDLAPPLRESSLTVAVTTYPGREVLERVELPPTAAHHRFDRLPRSPVEVVLEVDPWQFRERVDLSDGKNQLVEFRPRPHTLRGTVYRGSEGHEATISFRSGHPDRRLVVDSDTQGEYEAFLFPDSFYRAVMIQLKDHSGPPFVDLVMQPLDQIDTLDFHLPGATYKVRVIDETTGVGIPDATVYASNRFLDGGKEGPERRVSQSTTTDEEGIAELQPLRPGTVELTARAEQYLPSSPVREAIPDAEDEQELELTLQPEGKTARLRLLLPSGLPASGARLLALSDLNQKQPLWEGQADHQGELEVPHSVDTALLLVRHPTAGFLLKSWTGGSDEIEWSLPSRASPLKIQVLDPAGDPVALAMVKLKIAEHWLAGSTLAWLTESRGGANQRGIWQATSIPAGPIEILAWRREATLSALAGVLDPQAVALEYPWPSTVEVIAAE
ncbi:MAG: carboxypeptidase-like regulatory domain-containing protein [Acidobacteriota bacterium]